MYNQIGHSTNHGKIWLNKLAMIELIRVKECSQILVSEAPGLLGKDLLISNHESSSFAPFLFAHFFFPLSLK